MKLKNNLLSLLCGVSLISSLTSCEILDSLLSDFGGNIQFPSNESSSNDESVTNEISESSSSNDEFLQNTSVSIKEERSMYIIGSHWNSWDPLTIEENKDCTFKQSDKNNNILEIDIIVTESMIEQWCGFKFISGSSWIEQYGIEDVDFNKCNKAFLDMISLPKESFNSPINNRGNIEIKLPGQYHIEYNTLYNEYYTLNGVDYSNAFSVSYYPHTELDTLVEPVPINVWATATEEAVIDEVVKKWNATHEEKYRFEVNYTAISEADCGYTMSKDPTVSNAPALFLSADDFIATLQSKNIITQLKEENREIVEATNTEFSVKCVTFEDKVYGYPVTVDNGYFMWYNKSLVDEKTVGSLEDLLAHAKSLGKSVLMDVANGWYANSFIMSPQACGVDSLKWRTVNGQNVYETIWDGETGVKVSEYIANLLTPYYNDGTLICSSSSGITAGFAAGTVIAAVSGTWMEKDLITAIGEENLSADKLPEYHIDGKAYQMASFGGSKFYGINRTRPISEQQTALALGKLLTSKEAQLLRYEIRGSIPCNTEALLDSRYFENVSIGTKALTKQSAYACVQSQTAESRYWDIGRSIGYAYIYDEVKVGKTWAEYLKEQMDFLRKPL